MQFADANSQLELLLFQMKIKIADLLWAAGIYLGVQTLTLSLLDILIILNTFAQANVCIGAPAADAVAVKATAGSTAAGVTAAIVTNAQSNNTSTYRLSALQISMVRYNLPMEYSEALRSKPSVVLNIKQHLIIMKIILKQLIKIAELSDGMKTLKISRVFQLILLTAKEKLILHLLLII